MGRPRHGPRPRRPRGRRRRRHRRGALRDEGVRHVRDERRRTMHHVETLRQREGADHGPGPRAHGSAPLRRHREPRPGRGLDRHVDRRPAPLALTPRA